jgi:acetylornithine/N-succinyldiaminopimelate aminotransferase
MNIIEKEKKYILQTYKRINLFLVKGKGQYVWDWKGKKYLDFFSGISVSNLGHCHPTVVNAAKKQLSTLIHASNHYYAAPQAEFAEELVKRSMKGRVFLSNSGAEANECAIKLARKWGSSTGGRYEVITFRNSFHGRTLATLAATAQEKFHKGFEPMPEGFRYAILNDLDSVKKVLNKKTAAILVEPIQGEGGVYPCTRKFLVELKKLCDKNRLILIFDEVQCGLGRTGKLFAFQYYGVKPDVFTLAKSVAGGLPLGATVINEKYAGVFGYGDHGSTFGGNLVSCAAAKEVLKQMTPAILKNVGVTGQYLKQKLAALKDKYSFIKEVRGTGLMLGIELAFEGKEIVELCQQKGLIINCTQGNVIRFLPPLVITKKDVDIAVKTLSSVLENFK